MTEETTLEEFLSTDEPPAPEADDEAGDAGSIDPATPTYGWGEYACSECESATDRVWRDGSGFVCNACKEW